MLNTPHMDNAPRITRYLETSRDVLGTALADRAFVEAISRATEIVTQALRAGKKVLLAGNGGSAADAHPLAPKLMVPFYLDRVPPPAIALTADGTSLTAIGNDLGYEHVFSRQVAGLGQPGDVFVGL